MHIQKHTYACNVYACMYTHIHTYINVTKILLVKCHYGKGTS